MKKLAVLLVPVLFLTGCFLQKGTPKKDREQLVLISTSMGNIKVKLYNETPQHRDNFIKLVEEQFYDSLLFHRVMQGFMIQGGDPDSKTAPDKVVLGKSGNGYTIPAEFVPQFFHKRGALAAARQPDAVNPKKESSGCQFYIVDGRSFKANELAQMADAKNKKTKEELFQKYLNREDQFELYERYQKARKTRDRYALKKIREEVQPVIDEQFAQTGGYQYTEEQTTAYTTSGGAPHLDGDYTVFGEVVEGMEVVDKIAAIEVYPGSRPKTNIRMSMKLVKE